MRHTKLPARKVAMEALKIASEICVFTNSEIIVEEL
jgi:ATP-dependent HslUV protease subunit HslV